jgi:tetratricopeptide (TPR) repeat protein/glycosyltransferase involved in cell wall biosynthesis
MTNSSLTTTASSIITGTLPIDADCVCFLMIPGWETELRSNRWHFARRWARHLPVVLVQPTLTEWTTDVVLERESRIDNCQILRIALPCPEAEPRVATTATQLAQMAAGLRHAGYRRPLLWLYNPCLAELYTALPAAARVMHCTEAWFEFDDQTEDFRDQVRLAVRASDLIVAVSSGVEASLRRQVPEARVHTVTNGCDFQAYAAGTPDAELREAGQSFERIAVCAANLDRRVDFGTLQRVAVAYPQTLFALYGRLGELAAAEETQREQAFAAPNVRYLGLADPGRLPDIYAAASLGFIPYQTSPMLVESGFSLKALEMAASGLPVVSSLMRPLCGLAQALHVAPDEEDFIVAVGRLDRDHISNDERDELIAAARANDYDAKFASVLQLCDREIASNRPATQRLDLWATQCSQSSELSTWHQLYTRWWLADNDEQKIQSVIPVLAADDWSAQCYADNAVACRRNGRFEVGNRLTTAALALRGRPRHHTADAALLLEHARARRELDDLPTAGASLAEACTILAGLTTDEPRLLGEVLLEQGSLARHRERWSEAQPLLRAAVAKLAPLDDCLPVYARTLYELGCVLRGEELPAEALAPLQEALAHREELGSDYPDLVAAAAFELGCAYASLKQPSEALPWIEQAAELQIALTGPEHWAVAMTLVEQAAVCEALDRWTDAAELLGRAATIQLVHYGHEHPTIRQTWAHLGANMVARALQARSQGQSDAAVDLFQQALETLRLTDAGVTTATARFELGTLLRELGRSAEAAEHLAQAAELQRRILGHSHGNVATVLVEQAVACRELKRWPEAQSLLQQAVEIQTVHFGRHDPVTQNARSLLGQVLFDQARQAREETRTDDAITLMRQAIEHLREAAPDSAYLATAAYELGCLLRPTGHWKETEASLVEALRIAVTPELLALRISTLCELAASLRERGREAEAAGRFAEAEELRRRELGPDHWLVGVLIIEQGLTWEKARKLKLAIELLQKALTIYSAHFGADHAATNGVRDHLNCLVKKSKRWFF